MKTPVPAEESRGGNRPDWAGARPGAELPELPTVIPEVVMEIAPDYGD